MANALSENAGHLQLHNKKAGHRDRLFYCQTLALPPKGASGPSLGGVHGSFYPVNNLFRQQLGGIVNR